MSVERRVLGATGLEVSCLGFGAAPLGQEYGALSAEDGERSVRMALDAGINLFDTAPYYGRTESETRLGAALAGRRHEAILSTKCGRYDVRGFDFGAARVHASIDESLRRLRTDYVDLFHAHDVEFAPFALIVEETVPALRAVQAAGKARFVGITGLPVEHLARIARACGPDVVLSYCHYDLLDDALARVLVPLARERGFGLINASPLHMGVLSPGGPPPWHPAPESVKAAGRRAVALCREAGRDPAEVALRFACSHPAVATTLVGIRTPDELAADLRALEPRDDTELLARLRATVGPAFNRTWHEGLPENAPSSET